MLRIVSLKTVYFEAQLPETHYSSVHVKQAVEVTVDALPGTSLRGVVTNIYPVASNTSRSFTVRISLTSPDKRIRPQMFARGRILLGTHAKALTVPRESLLDDVTTSARIFLFSEGKAVERNVTLGFRDLLRVEILSGLHQGEKVVTIGQSQLQNGDKVQEL